MKSILFAASIVFLITLSNRLPAQDHPKHDVAHATAAGTHLQEVDIPTHGVAVFIPSKGSDVHGVLQLQQTDKGLHVWGEVTGLSPGEHGFHIHEFGDLRSDDGTATGGHFAAPGQTHGALNAAHGHEGDFGNITADENGVAKVDLISHEVQLHQAFGRAFVVHGGKDDLTSQPSGNSGPRVAVGIIGVAKAPEAAK